MTFRDRRRVLVGLTAVTAAPVAGCGTLFYPERRGQKRGRIDPAIAILNGIGLLFFIIPGAIAFGVDFYTGAIYLPGGRFADDGEEGRDDDRDKDRDRDRADLRVVTVRGKITPEIVTRILTEETRQAVDLARAEVWDATGLSRARLADLVNHRVPVA